MGLKSSSTECRVMSDRHSSTMFATLKVYMSDICSEVYYNPAFHLNFRNKKHICEFFAQRRNDIQQTFPHPDLNQGCFSFVACADTRLANFGP